MKKEWVLTQESFDALLAWLDPDREAAGRLYEEIRKRLIKIFTCRGCLDAEDLADETINRVTTKLDEITATYLGDPARYFYAVGNNIHHEYLRRKREPAPPPMVANEETDQIEYDCLERCMEKLTPLNRDLVLKYYQDEKRTKIDNRRKLAEQLGIAANALRIRAHRIRASLQDCVLMCVREAAA